ncbi:hypothetical protein IWQ60_010046 [Tieghemiomyces parasiticus]|uniref:Uncharacterized protein n=1 Tax=Tieghemiomyces parasiticus TaxID=78921 RepID=A0A9W7ZRZ8_9FUNG|nr:hypothetical protein IWQ60_010046 [Tieghemiomyces parasiticus]
MSGVRPPRPMEVELLSEEPLSHEEAAKRLRKFLKRNVKSQDLPITTLHQLEQLHQALASHVPVTSRQPAKKHREPEGSDEEE